jgi:hypothetical protein
VKVRFHSIYEAPDDDSRWQIFIRPQTGVWFTRKLPVLNDGATVKFACTLLGSGISTALSLFRTPGRSGSTTQERSRVSRAARLAQPAVPS